MLRLSKAAETNSNYAVYFAPVHCFYPGIFPGFLATGGPVTQSGIDFYGTFIFRLCHHQFPVVRAHSAGPVPHPVLVSERNTQNPR